MIYQDDSTVWGKHNPWTSQWGCYLASLIEGISRQRLRLGEDRITPEEAVKGYEDAIAIKAVQDEEKDASGKPSDGCTIKNPVDLGKIFGAKIFMTTRYTGDQYEAKRPVFDDSYFSIGCWKWEESAGGMNTLHHAHFVLMDLDNPGEVLFDPLKRVHDTVKKGYLATIAMYKCYGLIPLTKNRL